MSREKRIITALNDALTPEKLEVINESSNHRVPKGSETHFKIIVVSVKFINKSRVERHQLINNLLSQEFKSGLHALTMHLLTPTESLNKEIKASPPCQRISK